MQSFNGNSLNNFEFIIFHQKLHRYRQLIIHRIQPKQNIYVTLAVSAQNIIKFIWKMIKLSPSTSKHTPSFKFNGIHGVHLLILGILRARVARNKKI